MTRPYLIGGILFFGMTGCAHGQPERSSNPAGASTVTVTYPSARRAPTAWSGYRWSMTSYSGRWTDPVVTEVAPDSPASRAGLAVGDTLVSIDGESRRPGWHNLSGFGIPGRAYRVRFKRDGEEHEVVLTPEPPRPES